MQLGEPQIVADLETQVPETGEWDGGHNLGAGDDPVAFSSAFRGRGRAISIGRCELDVEEVQFAVSREQRAVRTDEHVCVEYPDAPLWLRDVLICLGDLVHAC